MPVYGAAAVVSGKKTLSDSEMRAYSRNRFADRTLRYRVGRLSDQEQTCHDRHQREIFQWKDFMRQSTRTSGFWSANLDSESEDWVLFGEEKNLPEAGEQKREGLGGIGASPGFGSSTQRGPPQRGGNCLSIELARSLTFQSEALSRLQKPWAYSYSATSYNSVYNDAEQLARGQEKRLYLRRASSSAISANSSSSSSSDQLNDKVLFRSRSSASDVRPDPSPAPPTRPLTGRSTPGMTLKPRFRDKLTASASIIKGRPKTTVGLVRVKAKLKKTAWLDEDDGGPPVNAESTGGQNNDGCSNVSVPVSNSGCTRVLDGNHRIKDNMSSGGDESAKIKDYHPVTSTENASIDRDKPILGIRNENGNIPDEKSVVAISDRGTEVKVNERTFSPTAGTSLDAEPYARASAERSQIHRNGISVSADEGTQSDSISANTLHGDPKRQPPKETNEKRVKIRLATEKEQVDTSHGANSELSHTLTFSVKDRTVASSCGSLKEDQSLVAPTTAAPATSSATPTPGHLIGCAKNGGAKRPKSVSHAAHSRRSSDNSSRTFGYLRQRSGVTSASARAERAWSGSPSQRSSSVDVSRRSSFVKIADKLEALQNRYNRRLSRFDDDKQVEQLRQNEVSGSPNEANGNLANEKEIKGTSAVKDVAEQQQSSKTTETSFTKATNSSQKNQTSQEKSTNPKQDKAEDGLRVATTYQSTKESPKNQSSKETSEEAAKAAVEASPEQSYDPDPEPDPDPDSEEACNAADFLPLEGSSSPDSGCIVFKGFRIRNYVPPQERYRTDPVMSSRRERSKFRLSLENPVCLSGNRGESKAEMIFPRSARQRVLQELVERNNQPIRTQDNGVVPPELRAKIDDFFRSIEPYCPKPELSLD